MTLWRRLLFSLPQLSLHARHAASWRRSLIFLLVIISVLPFTACAPIGALFEWCTDSQVVRDDRMLGEWADRDGKDSDDIVTISTDKDGNYRMIFSDSSDPDLQSTFTMRLFELDSELYVDAVVGPLIYKGEEKDLSDFAIPVHMVGKASITQDSLDLYMLDDSWTRGFVHSDANPPDSLELRPGADVLTAKTPELQQFLRRIRNDDGFKFDLHFRRVMPPAAEDAPEPPKADHEKQVEKSPGN